MIVRLLLAAFQDRRRKLNRNIIVKGQSVDWLSTRESHCTVADSLDLDQQMHTRN